MYELLNVPDFISRERFIEDCKNFLHLPFVEAEEVYSQIRSPRDFVIWSDEAVTVFVSEIDPEGHYSWCWRPWRVVKVDGVWKVDWLPVQ